MKICVIGHFGGKKEFMDGQTVKTKEVFKFLRARNFEMSAVDTYLLKRNPFSIILRCRKALKNNDAVVLIVSSNGYRMLTPLLSKFNERANKKLYEFVIGGTRYKVFDNNKNIAKCAKKFTKIYVETGRIKNEYIKRGFHNVEVIPNFKDVDHYPAKNDYIVNGELHTCVFSRILKEKGVSDAINAIKQVNLVNDGKKYFLDIYGKISDKYRDEFDALLKENIDCVKYNGVVNPSDSSKIINKYDVLIFPTYWGSEGFPGTLIDAFFASVPVIATKWNDNFEILEEGKNGIKVDIKNPGQIAEALKMLANDKEVFLNMSEENHRKALEYMPDEAMKPFLDDLRGLNER